MKKFNKQVVLIVLALLIINIFAGCSNKQNSKNTFNIEQFINQMTLKNYKFELKDVGEDFLPTTRKRMLIDKEAIDIYLYNNNREAENDAKRIDSVGCGYSNGNKSVKVSWASYPHFYKKGNIIVQYIGENEKIISDLKDILGDQFEGYKKEEK